MPNLVKLLRAAHRFVRAAVKRESLGEHILLVKPKINRSYELNYTSNIGANMSFWVWELLGSHFCGF